MQFQEISALRCKQCRRVFLTQGGATRHKEKCKHVIPVANGQLSMDEYCKSKGKVPLRTDAGKE